jgi:hypothetical protein
LLSPPDIVSFTRGLAIILVPGRSPYEEGHISNRS